MDPQWHQEQARRKLDEGWLPHDELVAAIYGIAIGIVLAVALIVIIYGVFIV